MLGASLICHQKNEVHIARRHAIKIIIAVQWAGRLGCFAIDMEQSHTDWVDKYSREMQSARSQCHDSYAGDVDELLSFSCNAARGVTEFEHSLVPNELLEEVQGRHRELLKSNRDNMCNAFVDACDFIQKRSQENVRIGQIAPRDPDDEMAKVKDTIAQGLGKKTRTTIINAIKDGALVHVKMAFSAWKVSEGFVTCYMSVSPCVLVHRLLKRTFTDRLDFEPIFRFIL